MAVQFIEVEHGLKDRHPYVREVAVIGVLKCYEQDAAGTRQHGLLQLVQALLCNDTEPQVLSNCLFVLKTAGLLNRSMLPRPVVISLLNNIRDFSDWAQCLVLDVLLRYYRPQSQEERFDMLEILDFGLNHTNSAVVLATAKLFLHYTDGYPDQLDQVLASIRPPLRTLLLGREPEIVYAALSNIVVLAERHSGAFRDLTEDLFCRPEDPSYLKLLKLQALVAFAEISNAFDVAEEATQYARDQESAVARAAVRTVAQIALKVPEIDGILDRLLLFLTYPRAEIASEAVAAMADVLRRFPDAAPACVEAIVDVDKSVLVKDVPAKTAYVWIVGEYGDMIQGAPYILESMVDHFSEEETQVKLALLSSTARLFFKRPPECYSTLAAVLSAGVDDNNALVRDRANMYHNLLSAGPDLARKVIAQPCPPLARFGDSQPAEVQDRIYDEWNSLSAIYRLPASAFIDSVAASEEILGDPETFGAGFGDGSDDLASDVGSVEEDERGSGMVAAAPLLLDIGDQQTPSEQTDVSNAFSGAMISSLNEAAAPSPPSASAERASAMDLLADLSAPSMQRQEADPFASPAGLSNPLAALSLSSPSMGPSGSGTNDVSGEDPFTGGFLGSEKNKSGGGGMVGESAGVANQQPTLSSTNNLTDKKNGKDEVDPFGFFGSEGGMVVSRNGNATIDASRELRPDPGASNDLLDAADDIIVADRMPGRHDDPGLTQNGAGNDVMGLDAFVSELYGTAAAGSAPAPRDTKDALSKIDPKAENEVVLVASPTITQKIFQDEWLNAESPSSTFHQQLADANEGFRAIRSERYGYFKSHVAQAHIAVLASPKEGSPCPLRFLLYAQRQKGIGTDAMGYVLVQLTFHASGSIDGIVRGRDLAAVQHVQDVLQTLLLTI